MAVITMRTTGQWEELQRRLSRLRRNEKDYLRIMNNLAVKTQTSIQQKLIQGELNLAPLTLAYALEKRSQGFTGEITIRTSHYVNSIRVKSININGSDIEVNIGFVGGVTDTGLSIMELAKFLEYGTSKMTARKPFLKAWEAVEREIKETARDLIIAELRRDLYGR